MNFSLADLYQVFDSQTLNRGAGYLSEGRVLNLSRHGDKLSGITLGSGGRRYIQEITLTSAAGGRFTLRGLCTCPMSFNCKHVAAVSLKALAAPPSPPKSTSPAAAAHPGIKTPSAPNRLEPRLADWLDQVYEAESETQNPSAPASQCLIYVLFPENSFVSAPDLGLNLQSARV